MTDRTLAGPADLDRLDFGRAGGLVPVVAQDAATGRLLMLAYANREALERTLETGQAHFWSRSRGALWRKGETSGHTLSVRSLHTDCDGDAVLALVAPAGPACHTGETSCFGVGAAPGQERTPPGSEWASAPAPNAWEGTPPGSEAASAASPSAREGTAPAPPPTAARTGGAEADAVETLARLDAVLSARAAERPAGSYTVRLLEDRNLRTKKLGEETAELVAALATGDRARIPEEAADLVYHLLVALRAEGLGLQSLARALEARLPPRDGRTGSAEPV